jgi:hypothetical protein
LRIFVGKGEVALGRWPTTIGGWKTIEKSDGSMALKYKESVTGDAIWPEILATPTWHPATGIPTRKLLIKRGDTWEPKTEIIGPGYRAAYGLVALVHHQIEGVDEHGEPQLMDHRIRTHGTAAYRSVKRGESNGCHRMHNYVVLPGEEGGNPDAPHLERVASRPQARDALWRRLRRRR